MKGEKKRSKGKKRRRLKLPRPSSSSWWRESNSSRRNLKELDPVNSPIDILHDGFPGFAMTFGERGLVIAVLTVGCALLADPDHLVSLSVYKHSL